MIGIRDVAPACCALCCADILGTPKREPLGKNGGMVNVCGDCATAPAVAKFGPERTYEGSGPLPHVDEFRSAAKRVMGDEYDRQQEIAQRWATKPSQPTPKELLDYKAYVFEGIRMQATGAKSKNAQYTKSAARHAGRSERIERRRASSKARREELLAEKLCINGRDHGPQVNGLRCAWCAAVHSIGLARVLASPSAPKRPKSKRRRVA